MFSSLKMRYIATPKKIEKQFVSMLQFRFHNSFFGGSYQICQSRWAISRFQGIENAGGLQQDVLAKKIKNNIDLGG